jgi:serine O-acetyltransferase
LIPSPTTYEAVSTAKVAPTGTIASLREDARQLIRPCPSLASRASTIIFSRGFKAVILYRISHGLWKWHIPLLPMLLSRLAQFFYAVDIAYEAELGPGIVIAHCFGVVIGKEVFIEGRCHLFHGVTLGTRGSEWVGDMIQDGHPHVERDCMFGAGSKILGPVRVGQNSVIGANAVVTRDVLPNSVMAGIPAKRISERPLMDQDMRPIFGHRRNSR